MNFILLSFASLIFIVFPCHAEQQAFYLNLEPADVSLVAEIKAEHRMGWGFKHVESEGVETVAADFTFSHPVDHFPIPLKMALRQLDWRGSEASTRPLRIREGKCLLDLSLKGELISSPPFIEFSPEIRKKYRFSLLSEPPFGDELFTLMEISKRPLDEGVEFTLNPSVSAAQLPFTKEIKVKAVTEHEVVLEVKTVFKRQKVKMEGEDKAVISGSSTALWKVDLHQSLNFSIEEEGMMNDTIQIDEIAASRIYQFSKKVTSHAMDY